MSLVPAVSPAMTMTSREIAELVDKRHDNVKRAIESLAAQGVIAHPQIEDVQETGGNKRIYVTQQYVFTGDLGKRDTIIVVAQLSPEFTARLVDRWRELEAIVAKPKKAAALSPAEMFLQSAQLIVSLERTQAEQAQQITKIEERLDYAEFVQPNMPNGAESISSARDRMGKRFGLASDVTTFIVRAYSQRPRVATLVKNPHAEDMGAPPTQVYWQKDVTAAVEKFLAEATLASSGGSFYRHPEFDRRFRLAQPAVAA